jgi:hypothetical protein
MTRLVFYVPWLTRAVCKRASAMVICKSVGHAPLFVGRGADRMNRTL